MSDTATEQERERLRIAIGGITSNVSNFPEKVQSRLLGQNMAPLTDKILEAVMRVVESDTEWETAGRPITAAGEEWEIGPIQACEELVAEHARPDHWVHQPDNDDLSPVVGFRKYRRRKAGPWVEVSGE